MLSKSRNAFKLTSWFRLALAALVIYVGMAGYLAPATVAEAAGTTVRIDAGSPTSYRDSKGQLWAADTAFVGGAAVARGPISVTGTADPTLYQTEHWGMTGYRVPVANGTYAVSLQFAETYSGVIGPGQRVFGVSVQGTSLGNLDVYALAGGSNRTLIKSTNVTVSTGEVNIQFTPITGQPMIDALQILPIASPSPYKQAVLADQPVAYWRLDEASGTTLADATGHGHTATATGAVTPGLVGALAGDTDTAMTFNGQTGFARDSAPVSVGPDFTIEAWVKASSSTENAPLVSLYGAQGTRTLYLQGQQFRSMADVSGNWPTYATVSASVDTTTWHHVVYTAQGGTTMSLFVDGVLSTNATVPATGAFSANAVLGWSDATWLTKFGGGLDEVALYASALPADRIKAHYIAGSSSGVVPSPSPTSTATSVPPTTTATPTQVPPTATPTASPTQVPPTATATPTAPNCAASLQSLIDAAPAGSVLTPPACIYRETVTINKNLTLDGRNAAEIRGSDVFSGWSSSAGQWTSTNSVPNFGSDPNGNTWLGQHLEQVFADATELTQVASNPSSSQFALDGSRHVVLTLNPSGHTMEVSTRQGWVSTAANNVTITRMTMKHSAQVAQAHPIGNDGYSGWLLSYSNLSHVHGTVVGLGDPNYFGGGTVGPHVTHNDISYGGNQGYGSFASHGALLDYNTIHNNGWGGYDMGWQGGGGKLASSNNTEVSFNEIYANTGPGAWWDIFCNGASVHDNKVHDNAGGGGIGQIMFEESSNATIHDNQVSNSSQGGIGIFASSSGGVEIYKNTVYHHLAGDTIFVVYDSSRDNFAGRGQNINVHDNLLIHDVDGGPVDNRGLVWWSSDNTTLYNPANNNRASNNQFSYPNAETGNVRFFFNGQISSIAAFAATRGGTGSTYTTTPR